MVIRVGGVEMARAHMARCVSMCINEMLCAAQFAAQSGIGNGERMISALKNGAVFILVFIAFRLAIGYVTRAENPWEVVLVAFIATALIFVLVTLGKHIVKGSKGVFRISVLLSAIWITTCFYLMTPHEIMGGDWDEFLAVSLIPVGLFYATVWIIKGFLKPVKP